MAFGGEPLRTGGKNPAKSKTADEREAFIEGNLIKAEKQLSGDVYKRQKSAQCVHYRFLYLLFSKLYHIVHQLHSLTFINISFSDI